MTLLDSYYLPGLHVEDHSLSVPLDWSRADSPRFDPDLKDEVTAGLYQSYRKCRSLLPAERGSQTGEEDGDIRLFYRLVTRADQMGRDLPLLVFLQGGPGGAGPRPMSLESIPWLEEASKHYRIVLPDQRGTGRSTHVDSHRMAVFADDPRAGADYLHHFLADSIIRDFEYLRRTEFRGAKWTTLGQSYGGFLTMTYLSLYPQALAASFVTGGVMHIPGNAHELYEHTVPRMLAKSQQFYQRYPGDKDRLAAIADYVATHEVTLPNGDPLTVRRLQMMGGDFGMKPSFERMHWTLDSAFASADGSLSAKKSGQAPNKEITLTDGFLQEAMDLTSTYGNPLYWTLQEFIYANEDCGPIDWAAHDVIEHSPEFAVDHRPLVLIGEAALPEMFREDSSLKPFHAFVEEMMTDTRWGKIYDPDQLAHNQVPVQCAVYFDDMYVDSTLQLDTLSRLSHSHAWVTNQYEHDGVRSGDVFVHLYQEALRRGDLDHNFQETVAARNSFESRRKREG